MATIDCKQRARTFSSEVEIGSRLENASSQESGAPFRFYIETENSPAHDPPKHILVQKRVFALADRRV
jgi:hypothetical protein